MKLQALKHPKISSSDTLKIKLRDALDEAREPKEEPPVKMAEGGQVEAPEAAQQLAAKEPDLDEEEADMGPKPTSIVGAIMQRREKMAKGGEVPDLKENYDDTELTDVSQADDSEDEEMSRRSLIASIRARRRG